MTVGATARTQKHETAADSPRAVSFAPTIVIAASRGGGQTRRSQMTRVQLLKIILPQRQQVGAFQSTEQECELLAGSPYGYGGHFGFWTPTAENLWALPKPLRRYIHHLQSNVDHVETMRENFRLRQENAALRRNGKLSELRPFFADHFFSDRKVGA